MLIQRVLKKRSGTTNTISLSEKQLQELRSGKWDSIEVSVHEDPKDANSKLLDRYTVTNLALVLRSAGKPFKKSYFVATTR